MSGPGEFGVVESMHVESNVRELPPPSTPTSGVEGEPEAKPSVELGIRIELGYARTDLGNDQRLDHQGVFLRGHAVALPWLSRRRRVGLGFGLAYTFKGLLRTNDLPPDPQETPELELSDRSRAWQQALALSGDLLVRPQREWLSIHLSPMLGVSWFANGERLLTAQRWSRVNARDYALLAGGSLALCTAWEIACVSGGAEILLGIDAVELTASGTGASAAISPWGWHAALGVDLMRVFSRANGVPR